MNETPLELETFQPHVGEVFLLEGTEVAFRLTEARDLDANKLNWPEGVRAPFSLTFRTIDSIPAQQGNYTLVHEKLGTITLFLVPHAQDAGELVFEAVFA